MTTTKYNIPVLDITPFVNGDEEGTKQLVADIKAACENIGFFQIRGHNFPTELKNEALRVVEQFFALPVEEKLKSSALKDTIPRGYVPFMHENIAKGHGYEGQPDPCEKYTIIGPVTPGIPYPKLEIPNVTNIWADLPADLRPTLEKYFTTMTELATKLTDLFALALNTSKETFRDNLALCCHTLRCIHYPAIEVKPDQVRMAAHIDTSVLTILHQDSGGLEVQTPEGEWIPVVPQPGAMVVNLGSFLKRWTNDKWRATNHRVVSPQPAPGQTMCNARISIAFFCYPNFDAKLSCLDSCCVDEPAKYPEARVFDLLMAMVSERKKHGLKTA